MRKLLKIGGTILAVLFALVIIAFIVLKLISDEQYKEWITTAATSATGRELAIESMELDFTTSIRIKATGVRFENADWSKQPDMLSVGQLEMELQLIPLLSGTADVSARIGSANIVAETNPDGRANWQFGSKEKVSEEEPAADTGSVDLPVKPLIRNFIIQDFTLEYTDGKTGVTKKGAIENLTLETVDNELTLDFSGDFEGKPLVLTGDFGDLPNALVNAEVPLNINGSIDNNSLDVSGKWGPLLPDLNAALKISAEVPSTSKLAQLAGASLEEMGAIDLNSVLTIQDGGFSISDITTNLNGKNLEVSVEGKIGDLLDLDGINLSAKASTDTLSELVKLFKVKIPVPLPPRATVSAKVSGDLDQLGVQDISIEILDEGITANVTGTIDHALEPKDLDANFSINVDSLATLSKFADMELPDEGAINVTGTVKSSGKTFSLEDLVAKVTGEGFNIQLDAAIQDLLSINGINANLKADLESLSSLSSLASAELPETDPIKITGQATTSGGLAQTVVNLSANSGNANVVLDGKLDNLKSPEALNVSIAVNASSLSDFSKFAQATLPERGPFDLTGTVRTKQNEYFLDDFKMTLDDQEVNGNLGILLADSESAQSTINGRLNIPYLNLADWLAMAPASSETAPANTETAPAAETDPELSSIEEVESNVSAVSDKVFSSTPFSIEALNKINADLSLNADRFVFKKSDLRDVSIKLLLNDGTLTVDPLYAQDKKTGGTLKGELEIVGTTLPLSLDAGLNLQNLSMPNLGGNLDFNIDLEGSGSSMAELMAGLDGQLLLLIKDGIIEKSFLTSFGTGFLSSINPFSDSEESTNLECAILRVDIKDGQANFERKLAMQMTRTTWRGGGDINLKTEKLDVGVVPKARTGLGLSAGSLASLVHVGGTLKKPAIQLDPKDVALKYGKYMAALSTGGLSILAEGLLNKKQANVDVCEKILDGTVFEEGDEAVEQGSNINEESTEPQLPTESDASEPASATTATSMENPSTENPSTESSVIEPTEISTEDEPKSSKTGGAVPKNLQ